MNKCVLIGRLTKTPELRTTPKGKQVCSFTIATNRINNEDADFIDCVVWDKQAENLCKYQVKGSLIGISGQLRVERYEVSGVKKTKTYIQVNEVEYLSINKQESKEINPYSEMKTKVESDLGKSIEITNDSLPF